MTETVAIIAQGEMGSAVGRRLRECGARVVTSLAGRSEASVARAKAAGFEPLASDDEMVAQAGIILSIVPPGAALGLAKRLEPALAGAAHRPLYVDCNAVSPETAKRIGAVLANTLCRYVDGGIIGGPPKANYNGPKIYVSGEAATEAARLTQYGLIMPVLDGPVGAASGLKMSYAGLTKGFVALGTAMVLGATRNGAADALHAELADSQPHMLGFLSRQIPSMFPKAYRWVAEMEEIAHFLEAVAPAKDIYRAIGRLYERMAALQEQGGADGELAELQAFCSKAAETVRKRA
jgi:putative dehydrogenase